MTYCATHAGAERDAGRARSQLFAPCAALQPCVTAEATQLLLRRLLGCGKKAVADPKAQQSTAAVPAPVSIVGLGLVASERTLMRRRPALAYGGACHQFAGQPSSHVAPQHLTQLRVVVVDALGSVKPFCCVP